MSVDADGIKGDKGGVDDGRKDGVEDGADEQDALEEEDEERKYGDYDVEVGNAEKTLIAIHLTA